MGSAIRNGLQRAWRTIVHTTNIYFEIDGEQRAAAFSYYVLFSLFPFFALLLTVGSSFFNSGQIIDTLKSFLPFSGPQQNFIWEAVHRARGGPRWHRRSLSDHLSLVFAWLF